MIGLLMQAAAVSDRSGEDLRIICTESRKDECAVFIKDVGETIAAL